MPVQELRTRVGSRRRAHSLHVVSAALLVVLAMVLGACGADSLAPPQAPELFVVNTSPDQQRIRAERVNSIANEVPEEIRRSGSLVVGTTGDTPPLAFRADDSMTMIGVEPDLAQLVADVLGLELQLRTVEWDAIFDAVEQGDLDLGFGNFTVTTDRQRRFAMSTYQKEEQAFAVSAGSSIGQISSPADIAGLRIGVGAQTKSEQILKEWNRQNSTAGLQPATLLNYSGGDEYYAALGKGEIDAIFGPMSVLNYYAVVSRSIALVGTVPGAGDRSAEIATITTRGSELAQAVTDAINAIITTGKYQAVLDRWALGHAAISESRTATPSN